MGAMLGKRGNPLTYLGPETEVSGDLKAKGQVRIDGVVHGSVFVEGELEVGRTGRIEGERIQAHTIQIHGEVKANLQAERVVLSKTARLAGNIRTSALDIEAGAVFVGHAQSGETRALEAPKEA